MALDQSNQSKRPTNDPLFNELRRSILNSGVYIPVNLPDGRDPHTSDLEMLKDMLQGNLSGDNKIGDCPNTKILLDAAREIFGINPAHFLETKMGSANHFCGVSGATYGLSSGQQGFDGTSYRPNVACDRILSALKRAHEILILAQSKLPLFIKKRKGGSLYIPAKYLTETQIRNSEHTLRDLADELTERTRYHEFHQFMKARFENRRMMQIILEHIRIISEFAPQIGLYCSDNESEAVCAQVPKSWKEGIYR